MKLAVIAIGKPGRGPEATLAADYAERATLAGRTLGLGPLELVDLEPRKPGKAPEAELILKAAEGAHLIACDERGKTFSSRAFAEHIAGLRDRGERRVRRIREAWLHMGGNLLAVLLAAGNFLLRANGDAQAAVAPAGVTISAIVTLLLLFNGWMGWALVYRHHVGVSDVADGQQFEPARMRRP